MKTALRYYTGVGSRKPPKIYLDVLSDYAVELERLNYKVRTGNAQGCDTCFATSTTEHEIYDPRDIIDNDDHWAYKEVLNYIPTDRTGYETWSPYVKALLARNMMQVLGKRGDSPSDFLLCWAPSGYYLDSSSGGTGYAIRLALARNIPVYNLFVPSDKTEFELFFESLLESE